MKIKIQNGAVEIKGSTILESINFEVNTGEHIGITGKNGSGKTTLLKSIIDNDMLSEGIEDTKFNIIKIGNYSIGYLEQVKINEELTLYEELLLSYQELVNMENRINYLENNLTTDKNIIEYSNLKESFILQGGNTYKKNIEIIIQKFGFTELDKNKKISNFSGGEKTKISFIKLLLSNYDLLLLDEPTNHLDITTIEWLETYLKNYNKAFIVVSHDRMFLDNIVDIIYEIEYGEVIRYVGNYSKFVELKHNRYNKLLKDYEYQQKEIKRLNAIYERFRYKPTKAKMALSKLKQIERMNIIDKPRKEDNKTFKANIKDIPKTGKIVLSIKDLEFGYDKVLGKINLEVESGKKIGIIGMNGIGKSTLLKTLNKEISPLKGKINYGYNVKTAYFDQNLKFETNDTILKEFCHKYSYLNEFDARNALGSFLFTREDVNKKLEVISGGEKVRLLLCEVFFSKANLLFLDEPTNHLDIIGTYKLEHTLKEYPNSIIFISHDRYFVKEIADELLVFENNTINYYKYGYEDYIKNRSTISNNNIKNKEKVKKEIINDNNKSLKQIEKELDNYYKKIDNLNKELYEENNYKDYKKVNEINREIDKLKDKASILEQQLMM